MLKLKYFGYLMRRADSLKKTLMLGKIEDRRKRGYSLVEVGRLLTAVASLAVVHVLYSVQAQ